MSAGGEAGTQKGSWTGADLGVDVVCQLARQGGLDGEGLVQELFVKVLLGLVDHDDRHAVPVVLGPTSTAHHLKYVRDGIVDIPGARKQ